MLMIIMLLMIKLINNMNLQIIQSGRRPPSTNRRQSLSLITAKSAD